MRKTIALFGFALTILLATILLGRGFWTHSLPTPVPLPREPAVHPQAPAPATCASRLGVGPNSSASISDIVSAKAALNRGFVLDGEDGSLRLLVDLDGSEPKVGHRDRPDVAVALVIDRSGSMAGDKIIRARTAAKELVNSLLDSDQLTLISYASDVSEDVPIGRIKGQRDRIARAIDHLLDGGGTNLGGGLSSAIRELEGVNQPNVLRRVILLSDGNANQGVTDPATLAATAQKARQKGITISTLGVGLDFNEDLMTLIAQSAGGGYYYARNGAAIAEALRAELAGLSETAAKAVEIGLEQNDRVTATSAYGYQIEQRGGRLVIPVGDMAVNEHRRVMVELRIAPESAASSGRRASACPSDVVPVELVLSYRTAESDELREHRVTLSVMPTTDAAQVENSTSREVEEAFQAAISAATRQKAASTFQSGDRNTAIRLLRDQLASTRQQQRSLNSAVLGAQASEIESAIDSMNQMESSSDEGRDLIKTEKLRARQVFSY